MSKANRTPESRAAWATEAPTTPKPPLATVAPEVLIRLRRVDYLRVAVEEVTLLAGKEIARRVLHAPDSPGVALGKAYEALERMVET